jgi:protein-L-isoaspartate(D-aspartate) O-methyltransferase
MNGNGNSEFTFERERMVEHQLRRRGIHDQRVLEAVLRVPRHKFVPAQFWHEAYDDHPLPIAEEQTISQPFIIAIALQALGLTGTESVLEVGTGSGYQTALLSLLARQVHSIERHAVLASTAEIALRDLQLNNVKITIGDGSRGWPEFAPYDGILVSAAAPTLPRSLVDQLADGGRMVIPVGSPEVQQLELLRKAAGSTTSEVIEGCRFVPLIGAEGF